jgi:hypothetical protein
LYDFVTVTTYQNGNSRSSYGAELVVKNKLFKWWNITSSANLFYTELNAGLISGNNQTNTGVGFEGKVISHMTWKKRTQLQFIANYNSPKYLPQGYVSGYFSFNLGFRHQLFKKQLTIGFAITDLFNTVARNTHIQYNGVDQTLYRKKESRIFTLNLVYRFGTKKNPFAKRHSRHEEDLNKEDVPESKPEEDK